ncbi:MAG: DEAD/DEAH box helicase family protein [Dysgonamonadaceae bacterium]|nr:DEAD/DEAH box helicase family protein [Dysgonamonadaceae bacterium]
MAKEAKARIKINKLLESSGWRLLDSKDEKANVVFEDNIKITKTHIDEWGENFEKTTNGFIDFLLLDEKGFPLVVLEAKSEDKNPLVGKEQARTYAKSQNCRFIILSNGNLHYLWDIENGNPSIITTLPTPESFKAYKNFKPNADKLINELIECDYIALSQDPNYASEPEYKDELTRNAYFDRTGVRIMRGYQKCAVHSIQNSVKEGNNRFLFEMATGTGKTLTSAAVIKLFLRTGNARRVLFLVDRLELEDQANKDMISYLSKDYKSVIYKEHKEDWRSAEIVVTTVQSLLFNNKYKSIFSPTDFDLIISDEAHRSIGGNARAVFEYFVGYKLGLTATPKDYLKRSKDGEQKEYERRLLLDTYRTFGCGSGEPTFRYSLLEGVHDGYLINPIVIDARTEVTTKLLSEEGYAAVITNEDDEEREDIFYQRDFERKFFSEVTNRIFCETFMEHAMLDPVTGEIGKTIVFAVSQNHAAKLTQFLNEIANKKFPNKYNSDFAMQVTSLVHEAKGMTIDFRNNKLSGFSCFNENYRTSKTRVCVTVGMMTTGYDCSDILNLCLMRPIFSPTDFVQIKGRGTRTYNFSHEIVGDIELKEQFKDCKKERYKLFDFFANCEYFEEKFNYDEVLKMPVLSSRSHGNGEQPPIPLPFEYKENDAIRELQETVIGHNGMKVDRMFFEKFEENIKENKFIRENVEAENWDTVSDYVRKEIFEKPEEYINIDKIKKSLSIDRRISVREVLEFIFGRIPKIKMKDELLEDEFERFIDDNKDRFKKDVDISAIRYYFKAYTCDKQIRNIIDKKEYAELNVTSAFTMADFKAVPNGWKQWIPEYIKNYVPLNRFM